VQHDDSGQVITAPSALRLTRSYLPIEPAYRRKGLGSTALGMMFSYASAPPPLGLGLRREAFAVRIAESNTPSISLFQKLGFKQTGYSEHFKEVEMRYQQVGEEGDPWKVSWEKRVYD